MARGIVPRFSVIASNRTSWLLMWEACRRTSGAGMDVVYRFGGLDVVSLGWNEFWDYGQRSAGCGLPRPPAGLAPRGRDDPAARGRLVITIENPDAVETGIAERWVNGLAVDEAVVAFPADGRERHVIVRLGPETRSALASC